MRCKRSEGRSLFCVGAPSPELDDAVAALLDELVDGTESAQAACCSDSTCTSIDSDNLAEHISGGSNLGKPQKWKKWSPLVDL